MTCVLVLQPAAMCPPARLGEWLHAAGGQLHVASPQSLPTRLDGFDAVVCLGGPMAPDDDEQYPWLAAMRTLLAEAVRSRRAVLGVCLGAQLLAAATGGSVRRMPGGPEYGSPSIALNASDDALLAELGPTAPVIQSHYDEVHELPPGAVHLASTPHCPNQAFRLGDLAWGLQGHIETTPAIVLDWASRNAAKLSAYPPGELEPDHLAAHHARIEQAWRPVAARFVELATGPHRRPPGRLKGRHRPGGLGE